MTTRYAHTNPYPRFRQCVGSACLQTHSDAAFPRARQVPCHNDAPDNAVPLMPLRSYGSPEEMNSISDAVLFARIDVAIDRVDRSKLTDDDHLASFITRGVAYRVDNYLMVIKPEDRPAGWSYQRLLGRVVADMTGAGAMANDWRTEKIGDAMSWCLRRTYSKEVAGIKRASAGARRLQRLKEAAETCYFCTHGCTPTTTLTNAQRMRPRPSASRPEQSECTACW